MSWSGGTYRKGNYSSNGWTGDASLGIGIEASRHDDQDDDFEGGINTCLTKDGQNSATADLPMGGYKHTNVANGTARNNYAAIGQVQDGSFIWCGTSGGTANAQTLTPSPAITAYAAGQVFRFIAGFTPTATVTLNVSGVGAKSIIADQLGTATGSLSFMKGTLIEVLYDGTSFIQRNGSRLGLASFDNAATARTLDLFKSRGTESPTNVIVQTGDPLGVINFWGANGTGYDRAAYVGAEVDTTPGASSDMPGRLVFGTTPNGSASTVERMRITNAGRVGINTINPLTPVHIVNTESGTLNTMLCISSVAGDVSTAALVVGKKDNNSTTSQTLMQFLMNSATTGQGQINANGASQAAFGAYSDERLKENIVDLSPQLSAIASLRPVEFDYKDGTGHQIGFVAQEVAKVYPDLVGEGSNGFLTLTGLGKNDARLIKAIQELAAQVASLQARLAKLER